MWTNKDASVDVVQLDVYDTETHGMATEVTEFPVEDGPDISDNVRRKPKTLNIEGYVSDTPLPQNHGSGLHGNTHVAGLDAVDLSVPAESSWGHKLTKLDVPGSPLRLNAHALVSAGFSALAGALGFDQGTQALLRTKDRAAQTSVTVHTWQWPDWSSRVAETFALLEKAYDTAALMTVSTDLKVYTNMVFADNGLQIPRKTEDGNGAPFSLSLKQIHVVNSQTVTAPKPLEPSGQLKKSAGSKALKDHNTKEQEEATRKSILAKLSTSKGAETVKGLFGL
jgi:hypothetical protein